MSVTSWASCPSQSVRSKTQGAWLTRIHRNIQTSVSLSLVDEWPCFALDLVIEAPQVFPNVWCECVRSVPIGATRCSVICENTVLLETQGPCESVRKCSSADTVTDDPGARVENVWRHFRKVSKKKLKAYSSVDGGEIERVVFSLLDPLLPKVVM